MQRTIVNLLSVFLLVAFVVMAPASSHAAKKPKGEKADPGLTGKIAAIDKTAKTITLDAEPSKPIAIDSNTSIINNYGNVLGFTDLKVGETAHISTVNLANKLTAVTIRTGVSAADDKGGKKKKKATS